MENLLNFFIEIGKLKRMPRGGWVINQIKNPETIAEHIFRTTIMAWILGEKKGLNREKIMKMLLIHDLCEVYTGDVTPYDSILPKDKKKLAKLMRTWPRFSPAEKKRIAEKKYKKEWRAMVKITAKLPLKLKKEIKNLWLDYKKGLTKEGRFANQADKIENLLQALEYWKKHKKPPLMPWWWWAREYFDDPVLIKVMKALEKKFLGKRKNK
ncbi:MAG: HD domain-containing protein [Candidatus Nealsonbacteria bacterium]|nr:HD domain-containing protein [Candidatus Nealsonbacteria bacterium]